MDASMSSLTLSCRQRALLPLILALATTTCTEPQSVAVTASADSSRVTALTAPAPTLVCDADNGGISLPPGFCAIIVADNVGFARHAAVRPNGDVYVALRKK